MQNQNQEKTRPAREVTPSVDIFENDAELLVVADVPGLDPNDIGVHVDLPEFRIEAKVQGAADKPRGLHPDLPHRRAHRSGAREGRIRERRVACASRQERCVSSASDRSSELLMRALPALVGRVGFCTAIRSGVAYGCRRA